MPSIDDKEVREILEELINFNESSGGRHPKVYRDSLGFKTIGKGFNLERDGARQAITAVGADYDKILAGTESLSDAQIEQLFGPDVTNALAGARRLVSSFAQHNLERQMVIVDMVFNLGQKKFAEFDETIDALNRLDYADAADEMKDSKWYGQVKTRGVRNVDSMRSGKLEREYKTYQQAIDKLRSTTAGSKAQKDAKDAVKETKEGKDGKDGKEASKEGKDRKDGKDGAKERKEGKETKEGKDGKEAAKDSKDGKDGSKEGKEGKDGKEANKETKDSKDGKDGTKERKEGKDGKETKEGKDGKDTKEGKETKEGKDGKELKDGPDASAGSGEWRPAVTGSPLESPLPSWDRYSV